MERKLRIDCYNQSIGTQNHGYLYLYLEKTSKVRTFIMNLLTDTLLEGLVAKTQR
jgi:hypothetical protein